MELSRLSNFRKAPTIAVLSLVLILVVLFYGSQQSVFQGKLNERNHWKRKQIRLHTHETSRDDTTHASLKIQDTNFKPFNISKTDDEFMSAQAEIQRQRKKTLRAACDRYFSSKQHATRNPHRLILDTENKLVYCSIAKVASTNWRLVFEKLAGIVGQDETVNQAKINRKLKRKLTFLDDLSSSEAIVVLQNSIKFMFARNPFSRILSSYRNKLDPLSTFKRAYHWQRRIGVSIMNQYRQGTGPWRPQKTTKLLPENYDLTFSEFIRFLSDNENKENPCYRNKHWLEFYQVCSPCNINYDVIGKLETIEDDAKYIFRLAKLDNRVQFPSPENSNPTYSFQNEILENYLHNIPAEYIRDLYRRYQIDFELFGYELPPKALKILEENNMNI